MEPELIYSLPSSCSNTGGPLAVGVFMKELVVARATNSDINLHYMHNGRDLEVGQIGVSKHPGATLDAYIGGCLTGSLSGRHCASAL